MVIIFNNEIEPIIQKLSTFCNEDSKKEFDKLEIYISRIKEAYLYKYYN